MDMRWLPSCTLFIDKHIIFYTVLFIQLRIRSITFDRRDKLYDSADSEHSILRSIKDVVYSFIIDLFLIATPETTLLQNSIMGAVGFYTTLHYTTLHAFIVAIKSRYRTHVISSRFGIGFNLPSLSITRSQQFIRWVIFSPAERWHYFLRATIDSGKRTQETRKSFSDTSKFMR